MDNFDPNSEFADDMTAYDIQYYHGAIFLQKRSREEIKYPYLLSGQLIIGAVVEQDLKGLSPLQIAQTYLNNDGIIKSRELKEAKTKFPIIQPSLPGEFS